VLQVVLDLVLMAGVGVDDVPTKHSDSSTGSVTEGDGWPGGAGGSRAEVPPARILRG
jgi:hypothetical protein